MTSVKYPNDELRTLADAACDGSLSDEAASRLEKILRGNPDAQRYYLTHVRLDGCLRWEFGNPVHELSVLSETASDAGLSAAGAAVDSLNRIVLEAGDSSAPFPSLVVSPLSPSSTPFVGGPVFSYMVASVVLCIMLCGAWAYKVSHVQQGCTVGLGQNRTDDELVSVGRVTGMKDCLWAKGCLGTLVGASVPCGRVYELESGLLEITYAAGARVIIEGPCSYKAESLYGGYLESGKLAARVDQRGVKKIGGMPPSKVNGGALDAGDSRQADIQLSESLSPIPRPIPFGYASNGLPDISDANLLVVYETEFIIDRCPRADELKALAESVAEKALADTLRNVKLRRRNGNSSAANRSPLFAVRTPTAIVTDLGTEFGVEVLEGGETQVHVFQGKVEAEWFGLSGAADWIVELTAGQAAGFDQERSEVKLFPTKPSDFVRAVPGPPARPIDVAAKKTIVHWSGVYRYGDPTKGTSDWTTLERFGTHHVNDGITDETDVGRAYWLGRERTADESFVIFLRGRYLVERIELMNTHNGPGNDRGTKDFEIWAADEVDTENNLVSPRLVLKGTLPCRFGAGANIPYDIFTADKGDFKRFNARYVKFVAKTFYENKGFGGCGLNEIRLFAVPATSKGEQ